MGNAWTKRISELEKKIETLERELAECRVKCEQQATLIDFYAELPDLSTGFKLEGGGEPNET